MMHRHILLGLVFAVLLPTVLCAQEQWLRGKVVRVGELGQEVPEVNVTVTIEEVGNPGNTTSQGTFRILIPQAFKAGDKITLVVDKPEWRIHYPWGGEARVPADLQKESRASPSGTAGVPSVFMSTLSRKIHS